MAFWQCCQFFIYFYFDWRTKNVRISFSKQTLTLNPGIKIYQRSNTYEFSMLAAVKYLRLAKRTHFCYVSFGLNKIATFWAKIFRHFWLKFKIIWLKIWFKKLNIFYSNIDGNPMKQNFISPRRLWPQATKNWFRLHLQGPKIFGFFLLHRRILLLIPGTIHKKLRLCCFCFAFLLFICFPRCFASKQFKVVESNLNFAKIFSLPSRFGSSNDTQCLPAAKVAFSQEI